MTGFGWSRRQIAQFRSELEADVERESVDAFHPNLGWRRPIVYFVQIEGQPDSPIKIGTTTEHGLADRMIGLQTGCPYKLTVLATMPGDAKDEERLHESFSHAHVIGEWFKPTLALLALIDGLRAGRLTSEKGSDTRRHDPDVSQCP